MGPESGDDLFTERREGIWAHIDTLEEKRDIAHKRLRDTLEIVEGKVESNYSYFDKQIQLLTLKLTSLESEVAKPDASKLILSAKPIISLVAAALLIAGMLWKVQSNIGELNTKFDNQAKLEELQRNILIDKLALAQKVADQSASKTELLRLEVQSLKETVLTLKKGS